MIGHGHPKHTVGVDDHPTRLPWNCEQIDGSDVG
jgi:hypothetical protein